MQCPQARVLAKPCRQLTSSLGELSPVGSPGHPTDISTSGKGCHLEEAPSSRDISPPSHQVQVTRKLAPLPGTTSLNGTRCPLSLSSAAFV